MHSRYTPKEDALNKVGNKGFILPRFFIEKQVIKRHGVSTSMTIYVTVINE